MVSNDEHLRSLSTSLQAIEGSSCRLVDDLTEEQLNWPPAPKRWSIAQCYEHLVVTGSQVHPVLARAIDEAHGRNAGGGSAPYRSTMLGGWMIKTFSDTSGRRRYPSFRIFLPAARPAPGVAARLTTTQRELLSLLARAEGLDLTRITVVSPATRLVRMNLGDALAVQVGHMARHLAQARRVREQPDFPPSSP